MSDYEWNCKEECGKEIVLAAIDNTGKVWVFDIGCGMSAVADEASGMSEYGLTFMGTHILSADARAELGIGDDD